MTKLWSGAGMRAERLALYASPHARAAAEVAEPSQSDTMQRRQACNDK